MKTTKLRDIASIKTGPFGSQLHKEDYVENGTPIVTVEHLGERLFKEKNLPKVSDRDRELLKKYILEEGDIVFSRVGSVDRSSFVDANHAGWLFSGRCLRIRPSEKVDPLYLYYFLNTKPVKDFIKSIAVGATMPSINTKILGEVEVFLPKIEDQQKISLKLLNFDKKIEVNKKINDNLLNLIYAVFSKLYARAKNEVPFASEISILGGGTPKTSERIYWNGGIPFFTPKDVGNPYTFTTDKTITEKGLKNCNSQLFPEDTVFLTARGTVGKLGIAGIPMAMNQSCFALIGKSISQILVYFYVLKIIENLKHKANGAIFDAITKRDISSESIMKLTESDSKLFLSVAATILKKVKNNTKENILLSDLRYSLLQKLMA